MDELQIIKAEVERLKESGCASPISVCDDLISLIESLEKEHVSESIDDLEISCDAELCFAHSGCKFYNPNKKSNVNHCIGGLPLQLRQKPVSENLEKEAERFIKTKEFAECKESPVLCVARHFANWQKQLMMKNAVQGYVNAEYQDVVSVKSGAIAGEERKKLGLHLCAKIKLIIIKED